MPKKKYDKWIQNKELKKGKTSSKTSTQNLRLFSLLFTILTMPTCRWRMLSPSRELSEKLKMPRWSFSSSEISFLVKISPLLTYTHPSLVYLEDMPRRNTCTWKGCFRNKGNDLEKIDRSMTWKKLYFFHHYTRIIQ